MPYVVHVDHRTCVTCIWILHRPGKRPRPCAAGVESDDNLLLPQDAVFVGYEYTGRDVDLSPSPSPMELVLMNNNLAASSFDVD